MTLSYPRASLPSRRPWRSRSSPFWGSTLFRSQCQERIGTRVVLGASACGSWPTHWPAAVGRRLIAPGSACCRDEPADRWVLQCRRRRLAFPYTCASRPSSTSGSCGCMPRDSAPRRTSVGAFENRLVLPRASGSQPMWTASRTRAAFSTRQSTPVSRATHATPRGDAPLHDARRSPCRRGHHQQRGVSGCVDRKGSPLTG